MQQIRLAILLMSLMAVFVMTGCSRSSVRNVSKAPDQEDLSEVRPHYKYVEPKLQQSDLPERRETAGKTKATTPSQSLEVTQKLETFLDTLAEQNKAIKYVNGFRIQIYVGNIRSEADAAKSFVYTSFSELLPYVTYTQPTYRVKVGDFMYKSDAEAYLDRIKPQYPTALIVPDKVEIKAGLQIRASSVSR